MSVAEDIHRAAAQTGKQRNIVLVALVAVIGIGLYLGSAGIEQDLQKRSDTALNEAALPVDRIQVSIDGLSAKLTGFANNQQEADDALAAVTAVGGIRHVENFLQVKREPLLSGPAGTPINAEAELLVTASGANDAVAASTDDAGTAQVDVADNGVSHVRAEWQEGVLTLSGAVSSAAEHRRLKDVMASAYGDVKVVDQVAVQPRLPAADWLDGFAKHLPNLRAQANASMESSASGLQPATPDQAVYVLTPEPAVTPASVVVDAGTQKPAAPTPEVGVADAAPSSAQVAEGAAVEEPAGVVEVAEDWLHLRSQMGRVAVSGVLGSEKQRQALANGLRVVFAPAVTYNSVRIGAEGRDAAWLRDLNSLWVLLQPVEFLDLEISEAGGVRISGWAPSEDQSQRIIAMLTEKLQPLPIHNGLRSIQSHYESYAAADMLNRNFARGIGFARDGVSLSWAGHVTLGQVAKRLRRQPAVRLSIGVHTDARGDVQANLGLTQKRADAIKNRLIELGVAADRLQAIGYGDTLPIADNNAPVGRALNRRVVFSPK